MKFCPKSSTVCKTYSFSVLMIRSVFPFCLGLAFIAYWGSPITYWAAEPKSDEKTSTVIAEGIGKDEKEARKAAFRDAVSKVVGTLIDAETLVKNDEVISEKILEYSGGFIKNYDTLKTEKTADGLFRVRIKAIVERTQIVGKLSDAKVTSKEVKGTDLLAEKLTKEEARKNATELLAKLFKDLPKLMRADVVGKPKLNADSTGLVIDLALGVDLEEYGKFVKRAMPLLEKVAILNDSVILTSEPGHLKGSCAYPEEAVQVFLKPSLGGDTPKGWAIWMVTFLNGNQQKARWNLYWVDSDVADSIKPLQGDKHLRITLNDANDELITEDEIFLGRKGDREINLLGKGDLGRLQSESDPSHHLLGYGGFLLYRPYVRPDDRGGKSTSLLIAPFSMHIPYYRYYLIDGRTRRNTGTLVSGIEYAMKVPIQHEIRLTDKELERMKSIKASVILK